MRIEHATNTETNYLKKLAWKTKEQNDAKTHWNASGGITTREYSPILTGIKFTTISSKQ